MTLQTNIAALCIATFISGPAFAETTNLKTAINPDTLSDSSNSGYSQVVVVAPNAHTVYVAGQVGITKDGPNTFEAQVDRSFENLVTALKAAGSTLEDVVKITVLIKDHDLERLNYVNQKRRELFGANPPASTLIPVPTLAVELIEFEVDAIAVLPAKEADK